MKTNKQQLVLESGLDSTFFCIQCRENPELYAKFASYLDDVILVEPVYEKKKYTN